MTRQTLSRGKAHPRHLALMHRFIAFKLIAIVISISAGGCSLYLDPTVCESDADCEGGVCQLEVGICIGPRMNPDRPSTVDMGETDATAPDMMYAGEMSPDMMASGSEIEDMIVAGEGGVEVVDADVPQDFECSFDLTALSEQGALRRDLPLDLNGASSWATSADELELRVNLITPDNERWAQRSRVRLGETSAELTADGAQWVARFTLPDQGERRVVLTVGDERDVRCSDQLNLTVDRAAPEITLVSPASTDSWIGALSGEAAARVNFEAQDLTRVTWRVTRDDEEVAREPLITSGDWAVDLTLEEGVNQFAFSATDELNQRSEMIVTLRYDAQPPGVILTSPDSDRLTVESPTFTLTGLVTERIAENEIDAGAPESNARVVVTVFRGADGSGGEISRRLTRTGMNGDFAVTVNLEAGSQHVEVCGYDQADNSSCTIVIMTRVEVEPCVNISSARYSLTSAYQVTGDVCSSVSALTLSVNGADAVDVPLNDATFTYPLSLTEAGVDYQLTLTARTLDGDVATESINVLWDESAPFVLITRPELGACLNDDIVQICGRVIDEESGTRSVWLQNQRVDLSDQVEEGDAWWEDFCVDLPVNNGALNVELRGENGATAQATSQVSVTIDRLAPSVVFPPENTWYRADDRGVIEIPGELIISGCPLTGQGFKIYKLLEGADGDSVRGRSLSPELTENTTFVYREVFDEGPQQLEVALVDQATNERLTRYAFQVDGSPPLLTLISPQSQSISSQDEVDVIFEASDVRSGVDPTTARITAQGPQGEETIAILTMTSLGGAPERHQLEGRLSLTPGEHLITAVISDNVGHEQRASFLYTVDLQPPVVSLLSHQPNDDIVDGEVVIIEAQDALSNVVSVEINGVLAETLGELWIASDLPIDYVNPLLIIDAEDEAGNRLSDAGQTLEIQMTASPYVWRQPSQLGAPHAGYTLSDGSRSVDTGRELIGLDTLWWSSMASEDGNLSGIFDVSGVLDPPPESGVSVHGGFSLGRVGTRLSTRLQDRLPTSAQLITSQRASIHGVLTLFTLEELTPGDHSVGTLKTWQKQGDVAPTTEILGAPALDEGAWVEVNLGLPAPLTAKTFAVGDVNGDSRADLISISPTGAFLFTSDEEGNFSFDVGGLAQRGLSEINTTVERLWWVALDDEAGGDSPPDLVAQYDGEVRAWLSANNSGVYQYAEADSFPEIEAQRSIDGWVHLDWDGDGDLDALAWSSGDGSTPSLLRRYTAQNNQWTAVPVLAQESSIPNPLSTVEWSDLDVDGTLEVLCVGAHEVLALESNEGTLDLPPSSAWATRPEREGQPAILEIAVPADIDSDGDEDWLFGLRLPKPSSAVDQGPERGELWGVISDPRQIADNYAPIKLMIKRENAEGKDASSVIIRVNADDDPDYERVYPARSFSETWINMRGAGSVDLQVIFPDRGFPGDHIYTAFEVEYGATLTVVDPQD